MIIDEVRNDSKAFSKWSTLRMYSRERFEREMEEYVQMMVDDGKFEADPNHGWDFDDQYYVIFVATDDNKQYCVMFFLRTSDVSFGDDDADKAYDRAMRGI